MSAENVDLIGKTCACLFTQAVFVVEGCVCHTLRYSLYLFSELPGSLWVSFFPLGIDTGLKMQYAFYTCGENSSQSFSLPRRY